jgi:hypothetical protein
LIQKGRRISREDTTDVRAGWVGRCVLAYGEGTAIGLAGLRGRVGRKVGRAEIKKKNFSIKIWIFEFTKALEICRRRFRTDFDMRIFPKFF